MSIPCNWHLHHHWKKHQSLKGFCFRCARRSFFFKSSISRCKSFSSACSCTKAPFVLTEINFRKSISGKSCVWLCCKIRSKLKCFQFDRKISQKRLKLISVVIFTSIRFLPSLTCMSLSHTHCSVKPSLLRPTHRAKRNHPHRRTTIQARRSQAPFHSDPLTTRRSEAPIHSDPLTTRRSQAPIHSDPLTIQARHT